MSKKKGILPFISSNVLDSYMFGYVMALRQNLPSISIERGIVMFKKYFQVPDEMMNLSSAKIKYNRMNAKFVQYLQEDEDTRVDSN